MAAKIIISILALLNVIFIPIFDVWGGLFPEDPDTNFFETIECALNGELEYWFVIFTLIYFIPSVFMFFSSFTKSNVAFKLFASLGFIAAVLALLNCIVQQADLYGSLEYVFEPEGTSISIGTWIGLLLYFLAIVAVPKVKEKSSTPANAQTAYIPVQYPVNNYQQYPQYPAYNNNPQPSFNNAQSVPKMSGVYYRCQKCNALLEPGQQFCTVCGTPKAI